MEKITICRKTFRDEQNKKYDLDYSMLICAEKESRIYGVEIEKRDAKGIAEADAFFGIAERSEDAEVFIRRLWKATALPVELAALCDDFISEIEWMEERSAALSAS